MNKGKGGGKKESVDLDPHQARIVDYFLKKAKTQSEAAASDNINTKGISTDPLLGVSVSHGQG